MIFQTLLTGRERAPVSAIAIDVRVDLPRMAEDSRPRPLARQRHMRMGRPGNPGAVTDPNGRVYGMSGLRIADASLMPSVPCANTHIPTLMIGEKIPSIIIAEHATTPAFA